MIKIKDYLRTVSDEWMGRGVYLGQGNFSELIMSLAEICVGTQILAMGDAGLYDSPILDGFYNVLPLWIVGLTWVVAGGLTLVGIGFYLFESDYHGILRFLGSLSSIFVWLSTAFIRFPSPFWYVFFFAGIAGMRVTNIVWRRHDK